MTPLNTPQATLDVTVFLPVYNEEENVPELYERLSKEMSRLGRSYEIIFVDDGSRDGSWQVLERLASGDPSVRVIRFKANFGQTAAMRAAIEHARGRVLVAMDADLQNDPADIPRLLQRLDEGFDVVSGWRKNRRDPWWSRELPSRVANWLISAITGVPLNDYGCTLKAYRREVLDPEVLSGEMHRFLPALAGWRGARISEVEVAHHPRTRGVSKYGIGRTFKVLIDLITVKFLTGFSSKPNYVFSTLGMASLGLSAAAFFITAYRVLVLHRLEATPMVFLMVIFALGGLQLILMGLLAEVVVRQRIGDGRGYIYTIAEMLNFPPDDEAAARGEL
jgi:glycosyltransferase involved in cell wall biosynthesis